MRIAYLVTALGLGGAETQVLLLAREMRARGHVVIVVRLRDRPNTLVGRARADGIETLSLGLNRPSELVPALARARAWVQRWRPDLVHSHMVHANLFARLLRLIAPVPRLICTAHSADEGGRWRMWAYRLTDRLADRTTNVSPHAAQALIARGAAPAGRMVYLPNGIDCRRVRPDAEAGRRARADLGIGEGPLFLAVGNLVPAKDYPTLVDAFAAVHRLRPDSRLIIAGEGPERAAIARQIGALGLGAAVALLGSRDDVPALLNACDVVVMSSRWEGLPTAVLEAMACARPVVTTEYGGAAALFGAAALVVPAGDAAALAAAMLRVAAEPELAGTLAAAGQTLVARAFAIERVAEGWERLYRDAAAEPAAEARAAATARAATPARKVD